MLERNHDPNDSKRGNQARKRRKREAPEPKRDHKPSLVLVLTTMDQDEARHKRDVASCEGLRKGDGRSAPGKHQDSASCESDLLELKKRSTPPPELCTWLNFVEIVQNGSIKQANKQANKQTTNK